MIVSERNTKWLSIVPYDTTGKTARYWVLTFDDCIKLGEIKWFGRWRQYAFFPCADTVYERTCMSDIAKFLEDLMKEYRINKQKIYDK